MNNASHLSEIIKGEISRFVNIFVNILVDKYENGTYISSLSVAKGLTPSINNIIEAVSTLNSILSMMSRKS